MYFPYTLTVDDRLVIQATANALCFALGLLALYPDEQEKLFEQIKSVTKGRVPVRSFSLSDFVVYRGQLHFWIIQTYADMPLLTRSLA